MACLLFFAGIVSDHVTCSGLVGVGFWCSSLTAAAYRYPYNLWQDDPTTKKE